MTRVSKLREVAVWQTVLGLTARVAQSPATIRLRVSRARPGSERAPAKTLSRAYHTIPVPRGWSIEQAWEAIQRGDLLTDEEPSWANILAVGGKFQKVMWPE
jgi:hypothetical protein